MNTNACQCKGWPVWPLNQCQGMQPASKVSSVARLSLYILNLMRKPPHEYLKPVNADCRFDKLDHHQYKR